jgi:hypothetical protein
MANTYFINCDAMTKINFLEIKSNQHWLLHENDGNVLSVPFTTKTNIHLTDMQNVMLVCVVLLHALGIIRL